MKPEMILQSDMLDILFEGRNKEYGAYNLRRLYTSHLFKAIGGMVALVLLFAVVQYMQHGGKEKAAALFNMPDSTVLRIVELPKEKQPEPVIKQPVSTAAKPVETVKNLPPRIVPDNVLTDPPPTVDVLDQNVAIGSANTHGDSVAGVPPPVTAPAGNGTGVTESEPPHEETLKIAEHMPEYPGGVEALRRFLAKNLRMPDEGVAPGQRVKIPTRFVVNKNGELTDVEFTVQADAALKNEILRVMRKMPRWIPGSQNGRTVAVYFTIPIIFESTDEQ